MLFCWIFGWVLRWKVWLLVTVAMGIAAQAVMTCLVTYGLTMWAAYAHGLGSDWLWLLLPLLSPVATVLLWQAHLAQVGLRRTMIHLMLATVLGAGILVGILLVGLTETTWDLGIFALLAILPPAATACHVLPTRRAGPSGPRGTVRTPESRPPAALGPGD